MTGEKEIVDVMQSFLDSRFSDVHTQMPGVIESYDPDTETATVKPTIKLARRMENKTLQIEIPPIQDVPVLKSMSETFILKYPIKKNCPCAIFFSEAGLGGWLSSSGKKTVDNDDVSKFSFTDCWCVPGLFTPSGAPTGTVTLELSDDGTITFLEGTDNAVNFSNLQTEFNELQNKFNTFLQNLQSWAATPPGAGVPGLTASIVALQAVLSSAQSSTADITKTKVDEVKIP